MPVLPISNLLLNIICLCILLPVLDSRNLQAQTNSCPEKFKAYSLNGVEVNTFCVGEKIRFQSCSADAQPDKEYYDANKNDGVTFPDTVKSVTYSAPGTYTVTQLINTGLPGNNQFERVFTVLPTPAPEIQTFGCAFNKINLKITDTNYDNYRVNFGDGVERSVLPGKDTIYQYPNAGTYQLTVKAFYRQATCVVENTQTIQTLPALIAPELQSLQVTRQTTNTGSISLQTSRLLPEFTYVVERAPVGSSNFKEISRLTPPASGTITLSNIDIQTLNQYRLRVTDACGTATGFFSNVLINQPISLTTTEKELRVNWPAYPNPNEVVNYQIYRQSQLIQTLPATATSFVDEAVACGRQYCYQLVVQLRNNRYSGSPDTCQTITATQAPEKGTAWATFNAQNQVVLHMQIPNSETWQAIGWQKNINNGTFSNLDPVKQLTYVDSAAFKPDNQPCYQATYTDSCGLSSPVSNVTCPVILKERFIASENKVLLNWSTYVGFTSPLQYTVEVTDDATGQVLQRYNAGSNLTFTDTNLNQNSQLLAYRIKVTSSNPAEISYSNKIVITQNFSALIPTAFSPNNDGLNDVFAVKGKFIQTLKLQIYNRWGQVIFESKNPNEGWNGKINGQEAPVGTYIYSVIAQDLNGNSIQRKGSVTLIK
jgi:gliding motility-associated-like protein